MKLKDYLQNYVYVGVRVILRQNLWVVKGLANGSVGTITDIIYNPDVECEVCYEKMLLCLLLELKKYSGPTLFDRLIPILPVKSWFKIAGVSCTCIQYPIILYLFIFFMYYIIIRLRCKHTQISEYNP